MDSEPSTSAKPDILLQDVKTPDLKHKIVTKDEVTGVIKVKKVGPTFKIVPGNRYSKPPPKKIAIPIQKNFDNELYTDDFGPHFYTIQNPMTTPSIVAKNFPHFFKDLPIHGAPKTVTDFEIKEFQRDKLREFVGSGLDDSEFNALEKICSPHNLRTGQELQMSTNFPIIGLLTQKCFREPDNIIELNDEDVSYKPDNSNEKVELNIVKKFMERQKRDSNNTYPKTLKYRGVKSMPLAEQKSKLASTDAPPDLEPGKDMIYRVRVYRPFLFHQTIEKDRNIRSRHSAFECDIVLSARQSLTQLRDNIGCRNDLDMRMDVSEDPDKESVVTAKTAFPSGFLFINNTFYIDKRAGCHDTSVTVRRWAHDKGLGDFPVRDMNKYTLDDILVKLAHPEIYVHQGNCEHIFMFSEIRLLNRSDPLHLSSYPCHTAVSQNQTIYCTTCAEFGAKWLVSGTNMVPFDPAFFCDCCYRQYLYKDGKKIGDFKAYHYKGNEINLLKSHAYF